MDLCPLCQKTELRAPDKICWKCKSKACQYGQKRRRVAVATSTPPPPPQPQGGCKCGRPITPGYKTCQECINRAGKRIKRQAEAGHCVRCGEKNDRKTMLCSSCQLLASAKHQQRRKQVFDHYGWVCTCCGEAHPEFLTMDHMNNDGGRRRREDISHANLYVWLIKNDFPTDFQPLCWNCNSAKRWNRICPHQKEREMLGDLWVARVSRSEHWKNYV
jgi:hypothetical protein